MPSLTANWASVEHQHLCPARLLIVTQKGGCLFAYSVDQDRFEPVPWLIVHFHSESSTSRFSAAQVGCGRGAKGSPRRFGASDTMTMGGSRPGPRPGRSLEYGRGTHLLGTTGSRRAHVAPKTVEAGAVDPAVALRSRRRGRRCDVRDVKRCIGGPAADGVNVDVVLRAENERRGPLSGWVVRDREARGSPAGLGRAKRVGRFSEQVRVLSDEAIPGRFAWPPWMRGYLRASVFMAPFDALPLGPDEWPVGLGLLPAERLNCGQLRLRYAVVGRAGY